MTTAAIVGSKNGLPMFSVAAEEYPASEVRRSPRKAR
jgi:hypothetical protein